MSALLALAALLGASGDQPKDVGLAFDCAFRPWDTADKTQLKPQEGVPSRQVYIWYGRFRPFGRDPVPLVVDSSNLFVETGQSYHAIATWPQRFSVIAVTPMGRRTLSVEGNKPVAGQPGRFSALLLTYKSETPEKGTMSNVMIGDCAVAPGVPFSEFESRRAAK